MAPPYSRPRPQLTLSLAQGADRPPDHDRSSELPEGQAFILWHPETSFAGLSPFKLRRELEALIGPCITARVIRSGAILIRTADKYQALQALEITEFCGQPVTATPATKLNSTCGCVYAPQLKDLAEAEILAELRSQGVVEVTRLRSKRQGPNPLLKVAFLGLQCPEAIFAGYELLTVRPWENNPRLCRHCGNYGHLQKTCRAKVPNCLRCGYQGHSVDDCTSEDVYCGHCHGPHPAWDKGCPVWQQKKAAANKTSLATPLAPPPLRDLFPPLGMNVAPKVTRPSRSPRRATANRPNQEGPAPHELPPETSAGTDSRPTETPSPQLVSTKPTASDSNSTLEPTAEPPPVVGPEMVTEGRFRLSLVFSEVLNNEPTDWKSAVGI